ncbi:MAG: helix-turn-helix transcriptional regulator [Alphaproteobacteria bacterium]
MAFILKTQKEIMLELANKAKSIRLGQSLTQEGLAVRSNVSLSSIKRFETTGQISLQSLLNIALALGKLDDFEKLFNIDDKPKSLFEEEKTTKNRQRGTIK